MKIVALGSVNAERVRAARVSASGEVVRLGVVIEVEV